MKIVVIEDNEDDRMLYRRALRGNAGVTYELAEADNGEFGLQLIQQAIPECVLLDYSLPGRNGIEVLKRIRALHPFIPVVMLTGQGSEAIAVAAMHERAQNYIIKSTITPETIQRVIRVAVEHCVLERRIYEQRTALEIFTRALAHDLKEPVRTIQSFLDLLATRETFSEKGKSYFHYIRNAALRMSMLIDTVYFYTRLDSAQEQIAQEQCDLSVVLEEAKENIRQLIEEHTAIITSDTLPQVQVNRMQMLQVLQNLLCNAIRHSDTHPVIHVHATEADGTWLFRVIDNGPGVAEEHRERIFEPFKRMSHHKEQGLGLGLAICKKIIESYGGKIWYEAAPDKGSMFLFTLPSVSPPVKADPARLCAQNISASKDKPLASVLLVEDSEGDIELARIMLIEEAHLRCNLLVAHDAYEALATLRAEAYKTGRVDLMLLDINMPGMDGFELLERMRTEDALKHVPVVMCSTSTYDKDMERAKALGVLGYLNKPLELSKLQPIIAGNTALSLLRERDGYALLRAA